MITTKQIFERYNRRQMDKLIPAGNKAIRTRYIIDPNAEVFQNPIINTLKLK